MGEAESLATAEAAREQWKSPSFLKELFLGSLNLDLIEPYPQFPTPSPEYHKLHFDMIEVLYDIADSAKIDATGEYPPEVLERLRKIGAFGMKIPKEYGGLGLSQAEYDAIMKILGARDGNLTALLSAHQSIGAPQPLKVFGTEEQKKKYLPRLAAGAISAFALTEPNVGSDPARMETTVTRNADGSYTLNGTKLWCTNGTLAEIIVVMAKHDDTGLMSAFIIETNYPGFKVEHRCRFMGLRALSNAVLSFKNVHIPQENLIGAEGQGLKIALTTLNTGRLAIPAGTVGAAQECLEFVRRWAGKRVQWGNPICKHEAIAHYIADMAANAYAMEAIADLGSRLAGRKGYDIRLEAAAAKEFNTFYGWKIIDDTMQIRGGRGYENETSLAARGEDAFPIERMMRDFRINRIFEGSSEIMHLFIAREAVDKHLKVAGVMIDPKSSTIDKLKAFPGIAWFYAKWFTGRMFGFQRFNRFGKLAKHMRFVERSCRKLARNTFYGMMVYRGKMQYKQAFLFRVVDIGLDLYAMAASILRAKYEKTPCGSSEGYDENRAEMFCKLATRRVEQRFRELWHNDDAMKYNAAQKIVSGMYGDY